MTDSDLNVSNYSPFARGFDNLNTDSSRDSSIAPNAYSISGHGHDDMPMANDNYGETYDEGNVHDTRLTRLQVFMQRSIAGWPLYTIIISLGQLLSAVSTFGRKLWSAS